MKENAAITQQKGRRVPIQLQKEVESDINWLVAEGHLEKINEINENVCIQPVVTTVKKDPSVKVALDAGALNKEVEKDKYQTPSLDNLINLIAEKVDMGEGVKHGL